MTVRAITQIGNPILREVAAPIDDPTTAETVALLQDLRDTLLSLSVSDRLWPRYRGASDRRGKAGGFCQDAGWTRVPRWSTRRSPG